MDGTVGSEIGEKFSAMLPFAISLLGRIAFPPDELRRIITQGGGGEKQISAYNLCDASRTQGQIAKELGLDPGNFSRTVRRWEETGVLIRIGNGKDKRLLGLYRI